MENLRMEKSIYENPLYRALISSKVDEKLAVDAVLSITSFNPNLAIKEDINSLRTEMKEEILHLATKEDINSLRTEMKEDINSLRTEMKEEILRLATKEEINSLRTSTKEEINSLRTSTKEEINSLRTSTKEDINSLRIEVKDALAKQTRWIIGVVLANISIAITILGFMLAS